MNPPFSLFSNSLMYGAQTGLTNPTELVEPIVFSAQGTPDPPYTITQVQIQVSTDKHFVHINKWKSNWLTLATPLTSSGQRTEDIDYGQV